MNRYLTLLWTFLTSALLANGASHIHQYATIDSLLAGDYESDFPCSRLIRPGHYGIGTFHKLDGELLLLNGELFQIKADGSIARPKPESITTPFATVMDFDAIDMIPIKQPKTLEALEATVENAFLSLNHLYGVHIKGTFSRVVTRSVPAQEEPYQPLVEVVRNEQVRFEKENVTGEIFGFWVPEYLEGVNVPGFHLHLISDDRTFGGHLLDLVMESGTVSWEPAMAFTLHFPDPESDFATINLREQREAELREVELGAPAQ